nr:protein ZBED8-like [Parasteatoda tepidariorum]
MNAEHEVLLYHTEVRWLSRGQVLKRIFMLKTEVSLFLEEKDNSLFEYFKKKDFIWKLAYLADIFNHMNDICLSIQGPDTTIMDATEKLQAFLLKMSVWKIRIQNGMYATFQMLDEVLFENGSQQDNELWIRNPFLCDIDCIDDMNLAKDEIIDLKANSLLKMDFDSKTLGEFWSSLREAYPLLAKRAMAAIIPFATVYPCEAGFSTLVTIKTKHRNRLKVEHDMRVALSKTIPQFNLLIKEKQQQPSH